MLERMAVLTCRGSPHSRPLHPAPPTAPHGCHSLVQVICPVPLPPPPHRPRDCPAAWREGAPRREAHPRGQSHRPCLLTHTMQTAAARHQQQQPAAATQFGDQSRPRLPALAPPCLCGMSAVHAPFCRHAWQQRCRTHLLQMPLQMLPPSPHLLCCCCCLRWSVHRHSLESSAAADLLHPGSQFGACGSTCM